MTQSKFKQLAHGQQVKWTVRGQIIDTGVVVEKDNRKFAQWPDGQETDSTDDWALENVEIA